MRDKAEKEGLMTFATINSIFSNSIQKELLKIIPKM